MLWRTLTPAVALLLGLTAGIGTAGQPGWKAGRARLNITPQEPLAMV